MFDYNRIDKENLQFVWLDGVIKFVARDGHNFGILATADRTEYEAREVRIHTPSEHTILGRQFDMEVQIIHYPVTEGDYAKKAVLSILFEKKYGSSNKFFDNLNTLYLPDRYNQEVGLSQDHVDINLLLMSDDGSILPSHFNYYSYQGSLSAPPCDEKTTWFIVADPLPLGSTVLDMFRDSVNVRVKMDTGEDEFEIKDTENPVIDGNYREIQPINEREIIYFDKTRSCGYSEAPKVNYSYLLRFSLNQIEVTMRN